MLFNFKYFKEVYYAFGVLLVVLAIGTIGFMSVEDYTLLEALYMTIITVSTVGFQEVRPLSDEGRLFTSFLIISSFGTFAYTATSISRYIVSGEYKSYFKNYRVNKLVDGISDHVIICGYGRNGNQAAKTLTAHRKRFVIIENDLKMIEILNKDGFPHVQGDATDEATLIKAGIQRATAIITTLPKDALNVFVVLTARELNRNITIISRASSSSSEKKMRTAGADNVIMPDKVGGAHMASLVVTPDVVEFLDKISVSGEDKINLEEILISDIAENISTKTIKEFESDFHTGCRIIGIKKPSGEYLINPSPDFMLTQNLKLFVLGTPEQIAALNKAVGKP